MLYAKRHERLVQRYGDPDFATFYLAYPWQVAAGEAFKAWKRIARYRPPLDELLAILEAQKASREKERAAGRFVPHWPYPQKWLGQDYWDSTSVAVQEPSAPPVDRSAALVAWAEVRAANQRGQLPMYGWSDPRTDQALRAIGGFGRLQDMLTRDVPFREREFVDAFMALPMPRRGGVSGNVVALAQRRA